MFELGEHEMYDTLSVKKSFWLSVDEWLFS